MNGIVDKSPDYQKSSNLVYPCRRYCNYYYMYRAQASEFELVDSVIVAYRCVYYGLSSYMIPAYYSITTSISG